MSWSDALDIIGNRYHLVNWGREVENGRNLSTLRFSTFFMRGSHIRAITEAIQLAPESLEEISIHFPAAGENEEQFENPFDVKGVHNTYLNWIGAQSKTVLSTYEQKQTATDVYDRLSYTKRAVSALVPNDGNKLQGSRKPGGAKLMTQLVTTIIRCLRKMRRIKLVAFYNLKLEYFTEELQREFLQNIYFVSQEFQSLDGVIFVNCPLGARCQDVLEMLAECYCVKLLSLQACQMTCAERQLELLFSKHREHRENLYFQKSLRDQKVEFKAPRPGTNQYSAAELKALRIRKELCGIQFIDFSGNQYKGLDEIICNCLENDKYVTHVDISGNGIGYAAKILRRQDQVINTKIPEVLEAETRQPLTFTTECYLPIYLCTQLDAVAKSKHELGLLEKTVMKKTVAEYQQLKRIQTIQLLQCYAESDLEMKQLNALRIHPIVKLLLANQYILMLDAGSCGEPLEAFVQLRLRLNRECMENLLYNKAELQLEALEKDELRLTYEKMPLFKPEKEVLNPKRSKSAAANRQLQVETDHKRAESRRRSEPNIRPAVKKAAAAKATLAIPRPPKVRAESAPRKDFKWVPMSEKTKQDQAAAQQKEVMLFRVLDKPKPQPADAVRQSEVRQLNKTDTKVPELAKELTPREKIEWLERQLETRTKQLNEARRKIQADEEAAKEQEEADKKLKATKQTLKDDRSGSTLKQNSTVDFTKQEDDSSPKQPSPKRKHNKTKDELLFEKILDAAFQMIMEKAGRNRVQALQVFSDNQETILDGCEKVLRMVERGKIAFAEVEKWVQKVVVF